MKTSFLYFVKCFALFLSIFILSSCGTVYLDSRGVPFGVAAVPVRTGVFGPGGTPYTPVCGTPIVTGSVGVGGICTGRPVGGGFIQTHPLPFWGNRNPYGGCGQFPVGNGHFVNPRIGAPWQANWSPAPFPQPACAGPGWGGVPVRWY